MKTRFHAVKSDWHSLYVWNKFYNKRNLLISIQTWGLYKHQCKIARGTLCRFSNQICNYFFDNILNITKLLQKFEGYMIIYSRDLMQNSGIAELCSCVKQGKYSSGTPIINRTQWRFISLPIVKQFVFFI